MEVFVKIAMFITSLSLLILIHELGHFLAARMFGVRVEKFYLFFNPWFSLFKFKIGETEFGIGWVPFGGYCKIAGMIDESMDIEQMKLPPKPYEFRSKPAWQRLLIMTGGVIMNIVLAVVIYIGMSYKYGEKYISNDDVKYGYVFSDLGHEAGFRDGDRILTVAGEKVDNWRLILKSMLLDNAPVDVQRDGEVVTVQIASQIIPKMLDAKQEFMYPRFPFVVGETVKEGGAARAGIMAGDSLVAIGGKEMIFFDQYLKELAAYKGQTVDITVARDSAGVRVFQTIPVEISEQGMMGVSPYDYMRFIPIQTKSYSLLASVPAGFQRAGTEISDYWKQLKLIFQPKTEAYKSLGGFMTIGSIFPGTWKWHEFWRLTAFISIVLAIMNILPIPALDGGHVMFLLWEFTTGRKPSDKFMEYAQMAGLLLLFALLIYANGNDIYRFFIKS